MELEKLSQAVIDKMVHEEQFIEIYVSLLQGLILAGKWIVNTDHMVTFRQVLVTKLQKMYEDADMVQHERTLFKILAKMHKAHVLGKVLVHHLLDEQQTRYEETKDERYMENFIILWLESQEYKEDYIMSIKEDISKRLQFMLLDNNKPNVMLSTHIQPVIDYTNYITYIDEYNNVADMIKDVGQHGNYIQFMGVVLRHTIDHPKDIDTVLQIIKQGLIMKIWTQPDINTSIDHIKRTELSDITIDAPYYRQHLDRIVHEFGCCQEKRDKEYRYKKNKNAHKPVR
jgi:hypothetical protein